MTIAELFLALAVFAGLATLRFGVPIVITLLIKQLLLKLFPAVQAT
jgi:hypothetical protein